MTTRHDFRINQGDTWSYVYTYRDAAGAAIDVSAYSAAMSIKRVAEPSTTAQAYLSSGSDADGGTITLGTTDGLVTLSMTAAQTRDMISGVDISALVPPDRRNSVHTEERFVYDLLLTDGDGAVVRALEGQFIVRRAVTP